MPDDKALVRVDSPDTFPESPLAGWKVVDMEPVHRTGTRLGGYSMVQITLRYFHPDNTYIQVEALIDSKERLPDIVPFLLISQDLPPGIRLDITHTKPAPWGPRR